MDALEQWQALRKQAMVVAEAHGWDSPEAEAVRQKADEAFEVLYKEMDGDLESVPV